MNNSDKAAIQLAVIENIDSDVMFTAFDITTNLRKKGMWLNHNEVKGVVHEMYDDHEMGSYEQQTIILVNINQQQQAILYVPRGSDVRDYHSKVTGARAAGLSYARNTNSSPRYATTIASTVSLSPSVRTATPAQLGSSRWSASQGAKSLDKKFRLRIPAQSLRDAGFDAGDSAYVSVDKNTETIIVSRTPNGKARIIDQYANLRVGLKQAGVSAKAYTFATAPYSVVATPK